MLLFNQTGIFPYQGKHSFPLPSLQVLREHVALLQFVKNSLGASGVHGDASNCITQS